MAQADDSHVNGVQDSSSHPAVSILHSYRWQLGNPVQQVDHAEVRLDEVGETATPRVAGILRLAERRIAPTSPQPRLDHAVLLKAFFLGVAIFPLVPQPFAPSLPVELPTSASVVRNRAMEPVNDSSLRRSSSGRWHTSGPRCRTWSSTDSNGRSRASCRICSTRALAFVAERVLLLML